MAIQDYQITPQDLDAFCKEVLSMSKEQLEQRAQHWTKLLQDNKEVAKFTNITALFEKLSHCDPMVAVGQHLMLMDFGFTLGETVAKRHQAQGPQNEKQAA